MRRIFIRLGLAAVLGCVMALSAGAAPAGQGDQRLDLTVQDKRAAVGDVDVVLAAANNIVKSVGRTGPQGELSFNFDDVANLGRVKVQVIVEECKDGRRRILMLGPGGVLPVKEEDCDRRRLVVLWWGQTQVVTIDFASTTLVNLTGGGLSTVAKVGIGAAAAGGATAAALAAGGSGGSSTAPPIPPPIATTPPPAPPTPPPAINLAGTFNYTFGPPTGAPEPPPDGTFVHMNVPFQITLNPDGSVTGNKGGLPFTGRRVSNDTVELVFEGIINGLRWLKDGARIRWVLTLIFNAAGTGFTANGVITVPDSTPAIEIRHPGTGTRQ